MTSTALEGHTETRRGRTSTAAGWALAAVAAASGVILLVSLPINLVAETGSGLVEFASVAAAAVIFRSGLLKPRLLQFALLSQTADMLTFVFAWREGQGERNPLAGLLIDWAFAALPGTGTFPVAVAGVVLVLLKLALVTFIVRIAPHLRRYRNVVLTVALIAGLIGSASNVVAFWPS